MLVITWTSGGDEGYSIFLPSRWFAEDCAWTPKRHDVRSPRGGLYGVAHCSLQISGKIAQLDYGGHHVAANEGRFDNGTIRISFADATRAVVRKVEWAEGSPPGPFKEVGAHWAILELPLDALGTFDPRDLEDGRAKIDRLVALRQGQPKFRQALIHAYEGRCAVTGCDVIEVLEAAHISPYLGERTNCVTNGLLLRADIHTLFDRGLIKVHGDYRIEAEPHVVAAYALPPAIFLPANTELHPSPGALNIKLGLPFAGL